MNLRRAVAAVTVIAAVAQSATICAQGLPDSYPQRPVVVVAGIAPGGPIDLEARVYVTKMTSLMGQSFVLDFKPGATGTIGAAFVAKARPDGHTLLVASASFTIFPSVYDDLSFDVVKDFAPLTLATQRTSVLQVNPSFPAKTLSEYLAYARANPGKINFGTTGAGSGSHLAGAWLHTATNTKVTFVHFKGTGQLLQEVIAGRIDVASGTLVLSFPLIKTGKVHPMVILNDQRSKLLPELPTVAEQGIPDFNYSNWLGFLAPAATPVPIVNKLGEAFARAARSPDVIASLDVGGSIAVGSTPAQFRQLIITETARWRKVIQAAGIKLSAE